MRDLEWNEDAEVVDRLLSEVRPVAGRADLTINQRLALAQAHATLALAAEQRVSNQIEALRLGSSPLDLEDETKIKTGTSVVRARRRNALRRAIRLALGLEDAEVGS